MHRDLDKADKKARLSEAKRALLAKRLKGAGRGAQQKATIPRCDRGAPLPQSFSQQRLWFFYQLDPQSAAYNIPIAYRIDGALDVNAIGQAFTAVVHRHEALRTTFDDLDGKPVQVVQEPAAVDVEVTDLGDSDNNQETAISEAIARETTRPFNLRRDVLVRAALLRLGPEEHILVVTLHHIAGDGWSTNVLTREIAAHYNALISGSSAEVTDLPVQYADYSSWQREWLVGDVLDRQLSHWRKELSGDRHHVELPTDRQRPATVSHQGAEISLSVPTTLTGQLRALSQEEGVTLYTTMLSAFNILVHRYSRLEEFVIGSPNANRNRAEIEGLIGFFVNMLPIRANLSGNPSFRELLQRTNETALGAMANQDVPFERMVEEFEPEHDPSRSPLFQVTFGMQNARTTPLELRGMRVESLPVEEATTRFDWEVSITDTPDNLSIRFIYNVQLFDAETIKRALGHYQRVLEEVTSDRDVTVGQVNLLTDDERQRLVHDWNRTERPVDSQASVHELFEQQAARAPEAIAVASGSEELTYEELNLRADQLATELVAEGLRPEDLVAVYMDRSPNMVVALLGILKAGGAYLPIDPDYPADRTSFMLADANCPAIVSTTKLAECLPEHTAQVICLDADRGWPNKAVESADIVKPNQVAYAIYTSGSTGKPKGVLVAHESIAAHALTIQREYGLGPGERVLQSASLSFDVATEQIISALVSGSTLVLAGDEAWDAHEFCRRVASLGITFISVTSAFWQQILQECIDAPEEVDLGQLRLTVIGGDSISGEDLRRWQSTPLKSVQLIHAYGPTETTVTATTYEVSPECVDTLSRSKLPIGRPLANRRIYILDDYGQPAPIGVPGEICIGGAHVAKGYLNRSELTVDRFVRDPFLADDGARMYRTGDLACYLPDGNIEFLGRVDSQVKVRGYRIELGEIEAVLSRRPDLREVVVAVVGTNTKELVAYLVSQSDSRPSVGELRALVKDALPDYMVPSAFVFLDQLPLTLSGKVDRGALPVPEGDRPELESEYVAPRNRVEQSIATLWQELLGVERVGVNDNFFELGGHSLLALQLAGRIRSQMAVEVSVAKILLSPTVAAIAEDLIEQLPEGSESDSSGLEVPQASSIPRCSRDQELAASFAQEGLWFLDQLHSDDPAYNVSVRYELSGPLNADAICESVFELERRHETLRTTLQSIDGRVVQVIHPAGRLDWDTIDLRVVDEEQRQDELDRIARDEARHHFDLHVGPLFRSRLIRLAEHRHVLLLTMHHIICDEWSDEILEQELGSLYETFAAGRDPTLPPLSVQFADFAAWQRAKRSTRAITDQLAYWKTKLRGKLPEMAIPSAKPRPAVATYRGEVEEFELPAGLAEKLGRLNQTAGSTMFMTLLAAFKTLLQRYTGYEDVVVGTPISNRSVPETEALIGNFLNTLVLRTDMSGDPTFTELVERVRQVSLEGFDNADAPLQQVVDEIRPERDPSRNPLFQVMFVFQSGEESALRLPGLDVQRHANNTSTSKFDLTFFVKQDSGLHGSVEYNTDIYDRETIRRTISHFETLLVAVAEDPSLTLSDIPLLSSTERQQLLVEWNRTQVEHEHAGALHELFESQVKRTPESVALVVEDTILTYQELNQRANQLANYLVAKGIGVESLVGVYLERSAEMVVAILGVLKAGGAYLPIDPAYPRDRVEFMLEDSQAAVLLSNAELAGSVRSFAGDVVRLDAEASKIDREASDNLQLSVGPQVLAYVIYTSGSTGRPKGVMIEHDAICNHMQWMQRQFPLTSADKVLQKTPFSFDASVWEFFAPLLSGAPLVMARPEGHADLDYLVRAIKDHQITILQLVPSLLAALLDHRGFDECRCLRRVFCGGEALPVKRADQVVRRMQASLHNLYGPTEVTIDSTFSTWHGNGKTATVPIGRPVDNVQAYVLDAHAKLAPIGAPGELYLGGRQLARGYLHRPELTAEKFVPSPFPEQPDARLYRTGDLVRWQQDGSIEFLGRIDDQVKVRGFRIELGEIEAALAKHSQTREVVVVAHTAERGDQQLVAYVVARGDVPPAVDELRAFLKETLPEYMVPSVVMFLEVLPLTPNGKVDRGALPAPELQATESGVEYVAPRNEAEKTLVAIWEDVLNVQQVGIHDNFFDLGGHSIISMQIVSRANQAGLSLGVRHLMDAPTIAQLATLTEESRAVVAEQTPVEGPVPLTPIQREFLERELPDAHHWNQAFLLHAPPACRPEIVEKSLQHLLAHHDALRLRFNQRGSEWSQVNARSEGASVFVHLDLSERSAHQQDAAMTEEMERAQRSLDLSAGPLLRAVLFDLGSDRGSRLLIVIHHLAVDAVSWRILLEDFEAAYEQLCRGEEVRLPAKTTSFRQWSQRLSKFANSDAMAVEADYWLAKQQSSGGRLPVDRSDGDNTVASSAKVTVSLDVEQTGALLQRVPAVYRTQINDVLLTALHQVMSEWTGDSSLLVNLEGHGREHIIDDVDLSRTVGWFTSIFPVNLTARGDASSRSRLMAVKNQLREVPHRGIGYGLLRYLSSDITVADRLRQAEHPQVLFNYLGEVGYGATESSAFRLTFDSAGTPHSPLGLRQHLLDIDGFIENGQLRIDWTYSENVHFEETIQQIAQNYITALVSLIDHCCDEAAAESNRREGSSDPSQLQSEAVSSCLAQGDERLHSSLGENTSSVSSCSRSKTSDDECRPASFEQQRLWFLDQLEPESTAYNVLRCLRLTGGLDLAALRESLDQLVERHHSLRTTFVEMDGQAVQKLHPAGPCTLKVVDLQDLGPVDRESETGRIVSEEGNRPFHLADGPLFRCTVIQLGQRESVLLISAHHIICDFISIRVLIQELSEIYCSSVAGEPHQLNPLPVQYADYAVWQQGRMQGEAFEKQLDYWRGQLEGAPSVLHLPTDRPRPELRTYRGASLQKDLSPELCQELRELSREQGVTLFMIFLAAFKTLLARVSTQEDIVVGCPIENRRDPQLENVVGLFLNTLALRTDLSGEPTFRELLQRVKDVTLGGYDHQEVPFEKLVETLQPSRSLNYSPLFQVMLNMLPPSVEEDLKLGDAAISQMEKGVDHAIFDLNLYVIARGDRLTLALDYNIDLFDQQRIEVMLEQLCQLLGEVAVDPDAAIQSYSLVRSSEPLLPNPREVIEEPEREPVPSRFAHWRTRMPDHPVVCSGQQEWSYEELYHRSDAVARALVQLGVRRGDVVAVTGRRSLGVIAGVLGTFSSGGVLLLIDEDLPPQRKQLMMREAGSRYLIRVGDAPPNEKRLPGESSLQRIMLDAEGRIVGGVKSGKDETQFALPRIRPGDAAYIFFTSGTTGVPKGVLGCHKGLSHFVNWEGAEFGVGPGDRVAQLTGLSFDVVLRDILLPLTNGATLCIPEEGEAGIGAQVDTLNWLRRQQVSVLHAVPSVAQAWLSEKRDEAPLPDLRLTFFAGEPLTDVLIEKWREQLSEHAEIVNLYGPTETTLAKCFYRIPDKVNPGVAPIGETIPQAEALLLKQGSQLCGIGEAGEIALRTPFRTLGYLNAPRAQTKQFVPNPFRDDSNDLIYFTGDRGRYRPDGKLEILGRLDDQVKIRGVRIEPGEIMAVLSRHESVKSCFIAVKKDPQEQSYLVAYVVGSQADDVDIAKLRSYAQNRLPSAMVPTAFVVMDKLPLNSNGKVDRRALPEPGDVRESQATNYRAPETALQESIAAVWEDLLGIPRIGIDDNLFEIGGHSLLVTRIVSRLQDILQVKIPLRDVFEMPTIESLAKRIEALQRKGRASRLPKVSSVERNGKLPLSYGQQRLWFVDQLESSGNAYHIRTAVRLSGPLDVESLTSSLKTLTERHEILRTTFVLSDSQPVQQVASTGDVAFDKVDLSEVETARREDELQALIEADGGQAFDLQRGPLWRTTLVRLDVDEHVLLVTMHHAISDGWSMDILYGELSKLYQEYRDQTPTKLDPLPVQYGDYAVWQRQCLEGDQFDSQIGYWKEQLVRGPEVSTLPLDRPRPTDPTHRGGLETLILDEAVVEPLRALGRPVGATLFMTMMAAFNALCYRLTGQQDFAVGVPMAGRNHREVEGLIGLFVNTLVLRTDMSGEPTFRELLARVRDCTLEAYANPDVPFDRLVQELQPARELNRSPLYQIAFSMFHDSSDHDKLFGLDAERIALEDTEAKVDLTCFVTDRSDCVRFDVRYSTDLFDAATIERVLKQYRVLLESIGEDPEQVVDQLSLSSRDEQAQLVGDFNDALE